MMKSSPLPASRADDEIDLQQLFSTLARGWLTIALCFVVLLVLGALKATFTQPTFRADALLQLEERSGLLSLPTEMKDLVGSDPQTITEIEIIRSRFILEQVIAAEHLDWQVTPKTLPILGYAMQKYALPIPDAGPLAAYARPQESLTIDRLNVPPQWVEEPITLTVTSANTYMIDLPDGTSLNGEAGALLHQDGTNFSLVVGTIQSSEGREYEIVQRNPQSVLSDLRDSLAIAERGRQSGILEVSYAHPDPQKAREILDAVTEFYARQNVSRSAAEAEKSLTFIEGQIVEARGRVSTAEDALNAYKQREKSVDLTFETESLLEQIGTLEVELTKLQAEEDGLKSLYTPSHPTYQQLISRRDRTTEKLQELRQQVARLPETQRDILNLTRDFELAQEIYTQLLTRAQEVQVLRASTVGNVRILDRAQTAVRPFAPRKALIVAISGILGLVLGTAIVLIRAWLKRGIKGAEDIESLGIPVFATVNYSPVGDLKINKGKAGTVPILALTDPADLSIEALRSLRTSLHFGMLDAVNPCIAITSGAPGAGKSFTSVNLAVIMAQGGQSVCLVDCDLRRGQLRYYFNIERKNLGLSSVLGKNATLDQALIDGPVEGLSVLPAGKFPPNPSELLLRSEFTELIAQLSARFDVVLLDCPPVLAVTDPVIVGRRAGTTLAIVRHNVTTLAELEATQRGLEGSGVKLAGVVLNGFDPKSARAGYSYAYNQRYAYDSAEKP